MTRRALALLVLALAAVVVAAGARDSHAIAAGSAHCKLPAPIRQAIARAFPEAPATAARVSCCESSGSVTVISRTNDVGIMQINTNGAGRSLGGRWFSVRYLQTVEGNLQAARLLFIDNGRRFSPSGHWRWSAHCWNR